MSEENGTFEYAYFRILEPNSQAFSLRNKTELLVETFNYDDFNKYCNSVELSAHPIKM